jgi:poly(3-hydroxybutyrate) depolymerase
MKELTIAVAGKDRLAYQFNAHNSGDQKAVILALHGAGGHPLLFRRTSELDVAASGFATVLFLAAERHGRLSRWNWQRPEDHDFLYTIIDSMIQGGIKTEDIYIVGMSNGGCLAQFFATTSGLKLGGIGTVCSAMPIYDSTIWDKGQKENSPNKVFLANALNDPIIPYGGGQTESDASYEVLSHQETLNHWNLRMHSRVTSTAKSSVAANMLTLEAVQCQYFTSEQSDHKLLSLTSFGTRHCWDLIEQSPDRKRSQQRVGRRWASVQGQSQRRTPRISEMIVRYMFN